MARISIVVPTYNERENITSLCLHIVELHLPEYEIVIVDDASPDGTACIARNLSNSMPVTVMERSGPRGLGYAYRDAFAMLLARPIPPEIVIQMDADGSHDVRMIPKMLTALTSADVVIGSRSLPGGSSEGLSYTRSLLSRLGRWVSHHLGISSTDATSGFRAWRISALRSVCNQKPRSRGFVWQVETVYLAKQAGLSCVEIPIIFAKRTRGSSKLSFTIVWEACCFVARALLL